MSQSPERQLTLALILVIVAVAALIITAESIESILGLLIMAMVMLLHLTAAIAKAKRIPWLRIGSLVIWPEDLGLGNADAKPQKNDGSQWTPKAVERWRYLMTLTYGDEALAGRLIDLAWATDRNRPLEWAIDVAIAQLIRDRSR